EVHLKYVQDQVPAACAFLNVIPGAPAITSSGSISTATNSFTITNNGTEPMYFNLTSGSGSPFSGRIREDWTGPTLANPTLAVAGFAYSYTGPTPQPTPGTPTFNTSDSFSQTTSPVGPRALPSTVIGVD